MCFSASFSPVAGLAKSTEGEQVGPCLRRMSEEQNNQSQKQKVPGPAETHAHGVSEGRSADPGLAVSRFWRRERS